jgi:carbonic anhydrase
MGHTGCGAVAAAEAIVDGKTPLDPSLEEMIVPIIPAVLDARRAGGGNLAVAAVEYNARRVAEKLAVADASLAEAIASGRLKVVAAVKQMHSGEVKFLDSGEAAQASAEEALEPA